MRLAAGLGAGLVCLLGASAPAAGAGGADGRFEERSSSHFRLLQDVDLDRRHGFRGQVHFERQVLEVLEDAFDRLDGWLGLRPRRRLTVAVHDPALFDAEYAAWFRFPVAGFYGGTIHVRGDTVVSQRLVRVLHHELVHAALDAAAPSQVPPAWMNEGLAEWFEARAVGQRRLTPGAYAALSRLAREGRLFALDQLSGPSFSRLRGDAAARAYLQSRGFVDFLARHHGARQLSRWCQEWVRSGDLARATRRVFRADLQRLEERFLRELRS